MKKPICILLVLVIISSCFILAGCGFFGKKSHCEKCSSLIDVINRGNIKEIYIYQMWDSSHTPISKEEEKYLFNTLLKDVFVTDDDLIIKEKQESMGSSSINDINISIDYEDGTCFSIFVSENGEAICMDHNKNIFVICGSSIINFELLNRM